MHGTVRANCANSRQCNAGAIPRLRTGRMPPATAHLSHAPRPRPCRDSRPVVAGWRGRHDDLSPRCAWHGELSRRWPAAHGAPDLPRPGPGSRPGAGQGRRPRPARYLCPFAGDPPPRWHDDPRARPVRPVPPGHSRQLELSLAATLCPADGFCRPEPEVAPAAAIGGQAVEMADLQVRHRVGQCQRHVHRNAGAVRRPRGAVAPRGLRGRTRASR